MLPNVKSGEGEASGSLSLLSPAVFVVKQSDGEAQAQLALRVGHSLLSA